MSNELETATTSVTRFMEIHEPVRVKFLQDEVDLWALAQDVYSWNAEAGNPTVETDELEEALQQYRIEAMSDDELNAQAIKELDELYRRKQRVIKALHDRYVSRVGNRTHRGTYEGRASVVLAVNYSPAHKAGSEGRLSVYAPPYRLRGATEPGELMTDHVARSYIPIGSLKWTGEYDDRTKRSIK